MFDAKSCTLLLLPTTVFETGYKMKMPFIFFKNIGNIIIFLSATVSTLLRGGHFMQVWHPLPIVGSLGFKTSTGMIDSVGYDHFESQNNKGLLELF